MHFDSNLRNEKLDEFMLAFQLAEIPEDAYIIKDEAFTIIGMPLPNYKALYWEDDFYNNNSDKIELFGQALLAVHEQVLNAYRKRGYKITDDVSVYHNIYLGMPEEELLKYCVSDNNT